MKNLIKKMGLLCGMQISAITSSNDINKLITSLKPLKINYELIRVGPHGNGGYLLPNNLKEIEAVFSPGVGSVSLFEEDCARLGMKIFLADNSVDGPAVENKEFNFLKKYIGAVTNENFITLDDWVDNSDISDNSDLLLQMDIEGFEYETIYSISNDLMNRFRIIVIEFHELNMLFNKPYFDKISNTFNKILQTHECVHIHPNNCCKVIKKDKIEIPPVMEFTFIHKNGVKTKEFTKEFPHPLDSNCAEKKTLVLPKCWYQ